MNLQIKEAIKFLRQGGVVAYPTDTAYGFAVDATNLKAIDRLYELKGRDYSQPVSIIFPNVSQAGKVVTFNALSKKIAKKYWPGPLTLVLPLKSKTKNWKILSAGSKTLGVRYPDSKLVDELVQAFGKPITTTSANISGKPTSYSVNEIKKQFAKSKLKPDFYIDGGKLSKGSLSTILHIQNKHVKLLREGVIKFENLLKEIK